METQDSRLTPETQTALAELSSYFGIRPGTTITGTLPIFDTLPEDKRPRVTVEYMTSTEKAEYRERMAALSPPGPKDETEEARVERVTQILNDKRKEHDEINEWVIKTKLVSIENYPDANKPGQFVDIKRDGGTLSAESWEALSYKLRPHVAGFILQKNFTSELEANAVKS